MDAESKALQNAGATLASFVLAMLFFLGELFVFQSLGWKTALQPLIIAGEHLYSCTRIERSLHSARADVCLLQWSLLPG